MKRCPGIGRTWIYFAKPLVEGRSKLWKLTLCANGIAPGELLHFQTPTSASLYLEIAPGERQKISMKALLGPPLELRSCPVLEVKLSNMEVTTNLHDSSIIPTLGQRNLVIELFRST